MRSWLGWNCVVFSMLLVGSGMLFANSSAEQTIRGLNDEIDRVSEKGDFNQVQSLRRQLAQQYVNTHQFGLAERQYELLLAARPGKKARVGYFIELGKMRDATEDYGRAITAYQDALHDDPKNWDANLLIARAYANADLNEQALEVYQRCLKLRAASLQPYAEMAHVYQHLGFLGKAIVYYQKALKTQPTSQTYLGLADCYERQGDIAHAIETLQKAKSYLAQAEYDVRLGDIFHSRGDLARAVAAWEGALKADGHRDDVRLDLALAYDQLGRKGDADHMFTYLLETYPQSPLVHFLHAWVFYERGDFAASRTEALRVQNNAPSQVVRHYNDLLLSELH